MIKESCSKTPKTEGRTWLYGWYALKTVPVNAASNAEKAPIIL